MEAGADPRAEDIMSFTVFYYAALNGSGATQAHYWLEELPDDSTRTDELGRTPIHVAAEFGCLESFGLLMEGTSVEEIDLDGMSVLHYAARGHSPRILSVCINKDADPSARDAAGMTALHHVFNSSIALPFLGAFTKNIFALIKEDLVETQKKSKKAQAKKRRMDRGQKLQRPGKDKSKREEASVRSEMISILLERDPSLVNMQDAEGNRALHLASGAGDIAAVRVLLKHGADRDIKDDHEILAEDRAKDDDMRMLFETLHI
jgi:ankyrin repeat protein